MEVVELINPGKASTWKVVTAAGEFRISPEAASQLMKADTPTSILAGAALDLFFISL